MQKFDRSDPDNQTRRGRVAQMRKGPGVFVYNGASEDVSYEPTVLRTGKRELVFDDSGRVVVDKAGRPVYQGAGDIVYEDGAPVLGGMPKVTRKKLETYELRGYKFPAGQPVKVADTGLALKLRGMLCFKEVDESYEAPKKKEPAASIGESLEEVASEEPKKRGRPPKKVEE